MWRRVLFYLVIGTLLSIPQMAQTVSTPGAITGTLNYPSDYVPAMRVYALATDGSRHYTTRTRANQSRFTISNMLPGKYYVVAYTDEAPGLAGGWSKAVPCGLKNTCRDHALIPVSVTSGETTSGIKVADWYTRPGVFPSEPSTNNRANAVSGIRSIDFRNFTYTGKGAAPLVLRDGREAGEGDDGRNLLAVKYVDFNGDGNEEALVTIATGKRGEGGYAEEYYVYSERNGKPRQIFHESRQKPQLMRVKGRSILIVAPFWRSTDAGCCPSALETAVYSWRASGFLRVSRQLKPSR
ncbi:MAG: hypothetical protein M3R67_05415 [Acidobacteriota bacterium]|nr:hypothetical protein [Acidobacteriota bacterium]